MLPLMTPSHQSLMIDLDTCSTTTCKPFNMYKYCFKIKLKMYKYPKNDNDTILLLG